jgi:hypothetical protein
MRSRHSEQSLEGDREGSDLTVRLVTDRHVILHPPI